MKFLTLFLIGILSSATSALAQPSLGREGEITSSPICTKLINRSTVTIQGTIATLPQKIASGDMVRHMENFKLKPSESREICASGPFYAGQRLDLTIRTLFPLFNCKTRIDRDIFLDMKQQDDDTKKYSATCS